MRAGWDAYFMGIAKVVATRHTCPPRTPGGLDGVGCVLVRDRIILSTGYNGSIRGQPHCSDAGHLLVDDHCVRTVHSEANAIAQAARKGTAVEGSTAYITAFPCWPCFKLLANSGVSRIVYDKSYKPDPVVASAAAEAGIELCWIGTVDDAA